MASACNSFPGKFMAAWVAVSTFAAIGFEHSVANMFVIPMGISRERGALTLGVGGLNKGGLRCQRPVVRGAWFSEPMVLIPESSAWEPTCPQIITPFPTTRYARAVGAPVTFVKFLVSNLLPVTLGNIVGGVALALAHGLVYGKPGRSFQPAAAPKP